MTDKPLSERWVGARVAHRVRGGASLVMARTVCFFKGHDWILTEDKKHGSRHATCRRCEAHRLSNMLASNMPADLERRFEEDSEKND